jgi:glycerol-3-phosphate acyltransferase PlsY
MTQGVNAGIVTVMTLAPLPASLLLGYLLGSIPFGLIFAWLAGAGDVRKIGSGTIGATNVLRTGKKWAAAATLLFDAAKGAAAVLIAHKFYGQGGAIFAALAVVLGHLFPIWLKFKGGKGIAVCLGVLLALSWPVGLLAAATWLIAAFLWKISSLSALITAAVTPALFLLFRQDAYAGLALVLSVLVYFAHRANIRRLLRGEEPRIGAKA